MAQITIRELLQLKNEVEAAVKALTGGQAWSDYNAIRTGKPSSNYGTVLVDGVASQDQGERWFDQYQRLQRLMSLNDQLHTVLGEANVRLGIPSLVRQRENAKALLAQLERAIPASKPRDETKVVTIAGGGVQKVREQFIPHVSSKELKTQSKTLRRLLRELQVLIERANMTNVEISFDLNDVDDLLQSSEADDA
jgi:hypothetical protein